MFTIDIHSHILPGIDDGANDPDMSLAMLRSEAGQGIRKIVFTPHFHPGKNNIPDFVSGRTDALDLLKEKISGTELEGCFDLRTAAEVRYSPALTDIPDLEKLCIEGTNVLLVEFSFTPYPEFVRDVFYRLQLRGFVLLIAHIERYSWLRKDTDLLYDLVCGGAYSQVNAETIAKDRDSLSFIRKMLECGLVHTVGSDTHNMDQRPPRMKEAAGILSADPGPETAAYLDAAAESLLAGRLPDAETPLRPRKSFWDRFRK